MTCRPKVYRGILAEARRLALKKIAEEEVRSDVHVVFRRMQWHQIYSCRKALVFVESRKAFGCWNLVPCVPSERMQPPESVQITPLPGMVDLDD